MNKKGFVYVLLNPSFPKLLKIGQTQRTPEQRAREIYKTGIPTPFIVAYEQEVSDCILVENLIHEKLSKNRNNYEREFFNIPLKEVVKVIQDVIDDLQKQHKLDFIEKYPETFALKIWWTGLSIAWKQIFRAYLTINYQPNELDLLTAVHSIIDNCQDEDLRGKVGKLIANKRFPENLAKWYLDELKSGKKLFNSYLPYELSDKEIETVLELTNVDCSDNIAVIDLKPLQKLFNLKELNCVNTSITDLLPLKKSIKLEEINLNYTKVDSLNALKNLPKLKKVICYGTNLSNEDIEHFRTGNINCEVEIDIFLKSDSLSKTSKKPKSVLRSNDKLK